MRETISGTETAQEAPMKTLYLVRHAQAEDKSDDVPDFERPLVRKGVRSAEEIARRLKKAHAKAEVWMSSPATRALDTAHVFADVLGFSISKILIRESLYAGPAAPSLLKMITETDDRNASLMIFGHNPSLTELAGLLVRKFEDVIPKAGVVEIRFPVRRWKDVAAGGGRLERLDAPESKAAGKKARAELAAAIRLAVGDVLAARRMDSAGKGAKIVAALADKLAGKLLKRPPLAPLSAKRPAALAGGASKQRTRHR